MWKNLFLPHPKTHQKAHLISWKGLAAILACLLLMQGGMQVFSQVKPGVLGVSVQMAVGELINLTNDQRSKVGLNVLTEDKRLDQAALAKGQNMLAENYWAHYSPSGKDPWGFIQGAGYKFSYAGENLARNFNTPQEVVDAWMASPSHRENLLNSHYQNIGMAVLHGTLLGENTTLIVQEFGTPVDYVANAQPIQKYAISLAKPGEQTLVAGVTTIDPLLINKTFGVVALLMLVILLGLDWVVMKKRGVNRLSSRYLAHLAVLVVAGCVLINLKLGSII